MLVLSQTHQGEASVFSLTEPVASGRKVRIVSPLVAVMLSPALSQSAADGLVSEGNKYSKIYLSHMTFLMLKHLLK